MIYKNKLYPFEKKDMSFKKITNWIEEDYELNSNKLKIPPRMTVGKIFYYLVLELPTFEFILDQPPYTRFWMNIVVYTFGLIIFTIFASFLFERRS